MKESSKSTLVWVGVSLLVAFSLVGVMWLSEKTSPVGGASPVINSTLAQISAFDRTRGSENAKVTVIEYSDFECPACAAAAPIMKDLLAGYGDDVRFVYRHFPLPSHKNSEAAAYAAEAAGEQGKFFEMHDALFEKQDEWRAEGDPVGKFKEYALSLGLDVDKFSEDVKSGKIRAKVSDDKAGAYAARVNATPTFFVNGRAVVGVDPEKIRNEIERSK